MPQRSTWGDEPADAAWVQVELIDIAGPIIQLSGVSEIEEDSGAAPEGGTTNDETRKMGRARLEPIKLWAVAAFFAFLSACLVARSTALYGAGLSPDSADYVRLGRDIALNGPSFLGECKSIEQPPVYPLLLAAISKATGASVPSAATAANAAAAAAIAAIVVAAASRHTRSISVLALAGALTSFSIPLTSVCAMAWSEPTFIVLVYCALHVVSKTRLTPFSALGGGLLTAAACLTRYAGIALLPVATAYVAHATAGGIGRKSRNAMLYAMPPATTIAAYAWRNWALCGEPFGQRVPSNSSLASNASRAMEVLRSWFIPSADTISATIALAGCVVLVGAVWRLRRQLAHVLRHSGGAAMLYASYAAAHVGFMVWTSTTTAFDPINTRLLSPAYPAFPILLGVALQATGGLSRRRAFGVVMACFAAFALAPARSVLETTKVQSREGAGGYNVRAWRESETIEYILKGEMDKTERLYSNAPDALYILAGQEAEMLPRHRYKMNSDVATGVEAGNLFERHPTLEGAMLVWFSNSAWRRYLFTPEELGETCRLERCHEFADGAIYRLRRRGVAGESDAHPVGQ